ncbi:MAG: DUF1738 domain-containing protein [Methylocystaceae bacterium]|nr:DUF1738 domain-containing protein [Methylocystaceae bacterium]
MAKPNFRQNVAEEMLKLIAQGTAPWQKPWDPNKVRSTSFNPTSEKTYRGMNSFWLEMQGYSDPRWMTYKQAAAMGAQVKKGEKSTQIEYWQWTKQKPMFDEAGNPQLDNEGKQQYQTVRLQRPNTFRANVFNAEQIDGLPPFEQPPLAFDPVEKAEAILDDIGVPIIHDQADRCFYQGGSTDEIHMVPKEGFENAYNYYAVALHEAGHSTGHESRLNRDMGDFFGSEKYAIEELRAEMASYMITTELGLGHNPERHAPYIKSWMKAIENDKNILFQAARDAELITEWVLNKEKGLEMAKVATLSKEAQSMQKEEGKSFFQKMADAGKSLFGANQDNQVPEETNVSKDEFTEDFEAWKKSTEEFMRQNPTVEFDYLQAEADWWKQRVEDPLANDPEGFEQQYPIAYQRIMEDQAARKAERERNQEERIYLDVHYMERKKAKAAGAQWDKEAKQWYVVGDTSRVSQWLPKEQGIQISVTVGPDEIDMAKEIGLQEGNGQWRYTLDSRAANKERNYYQEERESLLQNSDPKDHKEINNLFDRAEINRAQAMSFPISKQPVSFETLNDTLASIADSEAALHTTIDQLSIVPKQERQYLNVPYDDRHEAKKAGAKWDRKVKSWYAPEGVEGLDKWKPENTFTPRTELNPMEEFKQAIEDRGLVLDGLPKMDGEWHRVPTIDDKKGRKSGAYRGYLDGVPAGAIKNFKDGDHAHTWVATGSQMTEEERIEYRREIELRKEERAEQKRVKEKEVAKTAYGRIVNAKPAMPGHPYLQKKGITPNGLKLHEKSNSILVSMQDAEGFIWSTQAISEAGDKLFLKDSRKEGLFHIMGQADLKVEKEITICEGVATGASIHEATQKPVIIAFDSGNLEPVAKAIRAVNPEANILVAGDNDHKLARKPTQKKNIGIVKAKEAAAVVGGEYTFPSFTKEQKEKGLTDYNDLAQDKGYAAVVKALKPKKEKQKQMDLAKWISF